jgi:Carboxypeptidase regulatory-like domain
MKAITHTLAALIFATAASAQQPPPAPTGSSVIRGRIVAADTGKPLRRARVSFGSIEFPGPPRSVTTNADGRYEMKNLAGGRYNISVDRSGYLTLRYGQRRPLETARPLQIGDGQTVEKIDFSLPRAGRIAGHVVDETGDPVANAQVFALRSEFWLGRRQLVPMGAPAYTDDTGQFRIVGLAPGSYLLRAMSRETWTVTRAGKKEVMMFAPTYLPGTPDVKAAQRVTVGIGQQVAGADFALVPGRTVTVSGTAVDSRGRPLSNVMLAQTTVGPYGGTAGSAGFSAVAPDGTFAIKDVAPGEYTAMAAGSDQVARRPVVVAGQDVDGVALVASVTWSVTGVVTSDTGALPALSKDRVRISANMLAAVAGMAMQGEPRYRQALNDDWTFELGGIAGPMRFRVGLPDGWAVKSILYKGREIADAVVEPGPNEDAISGVQVILTSRVTTISGQLVDKQGAPIDGTIVVFSGDREKWTDGSRFIRAIRPDQFGQYQIKGLPPGDYLAVALDYVQDGMWNDPEYLESIRRGAERVTLKDGESTTVSPRVATP